MLSMLVSNDRKINKLLRKTYFHIIYKDLKTGTKSLKIHT